MPSRRVPPERRKRTEISCDKCKSRKQKCHRPPETPDGLEYAPCRYCQTHGFECVTTQLRKKRNYSSVEGLGTRLGLLESLVKGLVPEVDTSSIDGMRALGNSLGIPLPPPDAEPLPLDPEETIEQVSHTQAEDVPVLHDQQGQTQYIGPASSYVFQIRIRSLFAGGQPQNQGQFFLFGSNPTERAWAGEVADLGREMSSGKSPMTHPSDPSPATIENVIAQTTSPASTMGDVVDGAVPDTLIAAYFDHIHANFPVLHEASFREEYERCCLNPSLLTTTADPTWICSLLCVLILARRIAPAGALSLKQGQEAEDRWWRKVQALLPSVIFTSSVSAVQALLLAALHLNNTNHKDSSWTLTGTAVRIAIAIGLHREAKAPLHTPLARELRKRVWWTLYESELMQAASLDRPSAIDDAACSAGTPRQAILDMGSSDSMAYSNRLLVLLSQACRVVRTINNSSDVGEETYNGPLSPAAALIRDLRRWKESLPRHLCLEAVSGQQPSSQRAILLLHVQYHHVLCVLSRNAMLALAGRLFTPEDRTISNERSRIAQSNTTTLADVCAEAAQESIRLLLRLDSIGGFDQVTWWDFYFFYAAALVLVLNIMCEAKQQWSSPTYRSRWLSTSRSLLATGAEFSAKIQRNPLVPGTTHRYAVVIEELNNMSRAFAPGPHDNDVQAKQEPEQVVPGSFAAADTMHTGSVEMMNQVVHEPHHGLFMSNGPSGIQFAPDMSSVFAFPDASWDWREGQWNDIASMLLGNAYEPGHGGMPGSN
ncbi:fungal-specific transcription factor domain-containing protein [Xylariales sp. AK1849]|nr:fungal-specific transcription factor domain-containing protein [Xylariales sp. AK1849]